MNEPQVIRVSDRVKVHFDSKHWRSGGWFEGTVVKIEPYSEHRSFHWVKLSDEAQTILGIKMISVLNPRNIQKIE